MSKKFILVMESAKFPMEHWSYIFYLLRQDLFRQDMICIYGMVLICEWLPKCYGNSSAKDTNMSEKYKRLEKGKE